MNRKLIETLITIMEDEEKAFSRFGGDNTAFFNRKQGLYVEKRNFIGNGEQISVRPHTRYTVTPSHRHNYIEIMYVCNGTFTHVINNTDVVMEAGDILVMNQYISHSIKKTGPGDIGINLLVLPEFFGKTVEMIEKNNILAEFILDLLREKSGKNQYLHFKLSGNLQTNNLMENLIYSLVHKQKNSTGINQTLMGLLFLYLLDNIEMLHADAPNNHQDILIRSVLRYIDQHYKTAALSEVAANFRYPVPYLSRLIKQKTGNTFKELLQERRFDAARSMLSDTNLTVTDIVQAVGYENNSYFFRRFKEKHGISPVEYRKSHP